VLLWRTVNLIVNHGVQPREIFLSTFTEKAAAQLREGLRDLLGEATNRTGRPYDLGEMYVGTVHSLCQRMAADRSFSAGRARTQPPSLLDALSQYFHVTDRAVWDALLAAGGMADERPDEDGIDTRLRILNDALGNGTKTSSRHKAATGLIALFNRLSEECLRPDALMQREENETRRSLFAMYDAYLRSLAGERVRRVDFSLLQQDALALLESNPAAGSVFKHVIVDEYQDTNTVQERIFFALAAGHRNLCVVGDDDQALYRFRGATVENFVDFPNRCVRLFGRAPQVTPLVRNYRSRRAIVDAYTTFMHTCDWSHASQRGRHYRVVSKRIEAASPDAGPAVVATTPAAPEKAAEEIAALVRRLIDEKKVADPNQIAFLFPSLKSPQVERIEKALEAVGLHVYAPRAGCFLETAEATDMLGLMLRILGRPKQDGELRGDDMRHFHDWMKLAEGRAAELVAADPALDRYVRDRRAEIARVVADHAALTQVAEKNRWDLERAYPFLEVRRALLAAPGLSEPTRRILGARTLERAVERKARTGAPYTLQQILTRATSLDWHVLDLFYRLCGFRHFIAMFDLAEFGGPSKTRDEGPICNLSLLSQYLARFLEERGGQLLTAGALASEGFQRMFFSSYLFALFRLGESEYEDQDDPFPKGRIPFLTVHQSKGLEFPVVVLGNPRKDDRGPQHVEKLVHPHLPPSDAREPLDRMTQFDTMRMFYVALSRAKSLLVIAHYKGAGQNMHAGFKQLCDGPIPRIPSFDVASLPAAEDAPERSLGHTYSYTGDYMFYTTCPRRYMVFRHYGFASSTTQTQMFGSLVHRTIDDLHQMLISRRQETNDR